MDVDYPRLPRRDRDEDIPKMIGLWKVSKTIGRGSSGRVRMARHSKTGQYAAVRIVSRHTFMTKLTDPAEHVPLSIEREIVIMKLIDHLNIIRLYDVWETPTKFYLLLEYAEGGELFEYLCNKRRLLSTFEALAYFQQIISAVDYCHRLHITHRDLKPEALLLDQNGNIKVAGFGMAAWQAGSKNGLLQPACGRPHYTAPEVIMGRGYSGCAADIWSCGVILFGLLVGRLPFDDEDLPTLQDKIKSGMFKMPSGMDPLASDLITKMLQNDVMKRITISEILTHPFYLSQKPKSGDTGTPKLNDIVRPLSTGEEVDQDILANLRALCYGTSEKDIEASLKSPEPSWQKGVYRLLIQYRDKPTGKCNEEEGFAHRKTHKKTLTAKERQGITRTASKGSSLACAPPFLPRSASPTSGSAASCKLDKDDSDYVQLSASRMSLHSPSPLHSGPDLFSPVSPSDLTSFTSPKLPTLGSVNLPANQLPELHEDDSDYVQLSASRISLRPPTPPRPETDLSFPMSPSCLTSLTSPKIPTLGSVNLPAIQVPELNDDMMRHFFQQIVERLNALEARTRSPGLSFDTPLAPSMPEFNLPTYELLSIQDGFTARRECRRMLVNLGVRVVLMYTESTGVLKCTTDATKNLPGLPPTLTSVRFRVEVHGPTPAQIAVGYQIVLHLIQEGGSSLSFRSICNSLKRDWELDIPRIPRLLMPPDIPLFGHTETELGGYIESDERFVCVD